MEGNVKSRLNYTELLRKKAFILFGVSSVCNLYIVAAHLLLGRPRHRWEYNIRADRKEIQW